MIVYRKVLVIGCFFFDSIRRDKISSILYKFPPRTKWSYTIEQKAINMSVKTPLKVVNELMDSDENNSPLGDEQKNIVLSIVQQINTILRKVQETVKDKEYVDTSLPSVQDTKDTINTNDTNDTNDTKPQTKTQTKGDLLGDHVKITRYGKNEKDEFSLETTQDVYVPAYIRRK